MTSKSRFHKEGQASSDFVFWDSTQTDGALPAPPITTSKRRSRTALARPLIAATNGESGKAPVSERVVRDRQSEQKPSIVVIDERVLVRDCLVQCLQLSYQGHAVLAFSSLHEWSRAASANVRPTVLVLCTPGGRYAAKGNDEELGFLMHIAMAVPVIVVSDAEDAQHIVKALKNGARGYIPTSMALNVAVEAVRLVEAGGTFIPASSLISNADDVQPLASVDSALTARQIMVLRALHSGLANKQIAYELNMCESTVKVHIRHIMRKLKVRNRTQIAVKASSLLQL